MVNRQIHVFLFVVLSGWSLPGISAPELAWPSEKQSLETIETYLSAVWSDGTRIVGVAGGRNTVLDFAFKPDAATRDLVFGKMTDQVRKPLFDKGQVVDWRGIIDDASTGTAKLLLLGGDFSIGEVDPVGLREIQRRSVPWDLVKPAADSRGEPTAPETAAMRALIKKRWLVTEEPRVVGITPVPAAWQGKKKDARRFFVATRVRDFPLLELSCRTDEASACVVDRACNLEGAVGLAPESIRGVATSAGSRTLVLGDAVGHRLLFFRYDSCFHVQRTKGEVPLPRKMRRLVNFFVDRDERLYLLADGKDDYLNASLYFWSKNAWLP